MEQEPVRNTPQGSVLDKAPMKIGCVSLAVRDLPRVCAFYQDVIGLTQLTGSESRAVLGVGDSPLLELIGDPTLARVDGRAAGLFHTAFLLPSRTDLGRWLAHAITRGTALQGASDHIVSEALYLADPEGNGIEMYADRPPSHWRNAQGEIHMTTDPLDLQDLQAAAGESHWSGFPDGGLIGHVHLQVGDTRMAENFYLDVLGMELTSRYPGASFLGSGGYHHQIAGNVWNSRGAGRRRAHTTGLSGIGIVMRTEEELEYLMRRAREANCLIASDSQQSKLSDPWGNQLTAASWPRWAALW